MAKIVVAGKEYDLPESFTYRELGLIKRIAGVRTRELGSALEEGDAELIAALALIAMRRSGADVSEDFILDLDISAITIAAEAGDAGPPDGPADADARGNGQTKTQHVSRAASGTRAS